MFVVVIDSSFTIFFPLSFSGHVIYIYIYIFVIDNFAFYLLKFCYIHFSTLLYRPNNHV